MPKNNLLKKIFCYKDRSTYIKYLIILLTFIIFPVLLTSVMYINTFISGIQEEVLISNRISIIGLSQLIDNNLESVEQSILNVLLNNDIKIDENILLVNSTGSLAGFSNLKAYLSRIQVSSSLIEEVFVYFKKAGLVLGSRSACDFNTFFGVIHKYEKYDLEFWKDYFNNNRYKHTNVIPAMNVYESYSNSQIYDSPIITFCRGVNQYKDDPTVIYGLSVKTTKFQNMIDKLSITANSFVYILDQDSTIITSTDKENKFFDYINKDFIDKAYKNSINTQYKLGDQNVNVIVTNPSKYNLIYVVVIPTKEITNRSKYIKSILIFFCIMIITFACIAAVIASGRLYKPIRKIIDIIETNTKSNIERNRNEFEYIGSNIIDIFTNSKNLDSALKESLVFSRENILMNLIKGRCSFYNDTPGILETLKINLNKPNFIVFCIKIDSFKNLKLKYNELDRESFKFYISNISEETSAPYGICFPSGDDEMCLLLNYNNSVQLGKNMFNIAQQVKQNVKNYLPFTITIGVGTIKKDIHDICKSYEEALSALNYRVVNGRDQIIEYEQISAINTSYYYPSDKEKSIINLLKAGDYNNSIKTIEQIINENYARNISYHHLHYVLSELLSVILTTVYELGGKIQDIFNVEANLNDDLFQNETIEDIKCWFQKACSRLCDYITNQRESGNTELARRINQFILDNYNKEITLENIADHFNMSYSYLSRYFKQQTGINFIDHLYQLRIEKAKEMLRKPDCRINQVAESVGFYSVNNFIRVFKKYEGVTPGKFKEFQ